MQKMAEHSTAILEQYGDGEDFFNLRLAESKVREAMERGARAMVDIGRHLIVIKEHIAHGEWLGSLERMNVAPRTAQKMMQAAVKFLASPGSQKVLASAGSRGKALELLVLDDDELEQLGDGATVAGLTLDEIERMPSSELRKALREARQDKEALDSVIADKNAALDEATAKLKKFKKLPPDEVAQQLRASVAELEGEVEHQVRVNLGAAMEALSDQEGDHTGFITTQISLLENALKDLRESLGINGVAWEQAEE